MSIDLTASRFFHYFLFHPRSEFLSKKDQRIVKIARLAFWMGTIAMGPLFCRLFLYNRNPPINSTKVDRVQREVFGEEEKRMPSNSPPAPLSPASRAPIASENAGQIAINAIEKPRMRMTIQAFVDAARNAICEEWLQQEVPIVDVDPAVESEVQLLNEIQREFASIESKVQKAQEKLAQAQEIWHKEAAAMSVKAFQNELEEAKKNLAKIEIPQKFDLELKPRPIPQYNKNFFNWRLIESIKGKISMGEDAFCEWLGSAGKFKEGSNVQAGVTKIVGSWLNRNVRREKLVNSQRIFEPIISQSFASNLELNPETTIFVAEFLFNAMGENEKLLAFLERHLGKGGQLGDLLLHLLLKVSSDTFKKMAGTWIDPAGDDTRNKKHFSGYFSNAWRQTFWKTSHPRPLEFYRKMANAFQEIFKKDYSQYLGDMVIENYGDPELIAIATLFLIQEGKGETSVADHFKDFIHARWQREPKSKAMFEEFAKKYLEEDVFNRYFPFFLS